ncbi:hypothetical protein ACFL0Y_00165 [Patescibacteria group bacterium]
MEIVKVKDQEQLTPDLEESMPGISGIIDSAGRGDINSISALRIIMGLRMENLETRERLINHLHDSL